ncbi:MAG: hypothetical protein K2Q21_02520 [Chitinophagaceae bacterium]|nr:hypothetical protein [Chitinophagaceae bacterium]
MKKFRFIILILLVAVGCSNSSNNEKVPVVQAALQSTDASSGSINDFDVFLEKFNSDSVFQFSCIEFPLKLSSIGEDGHKVSLISMEKWVFTKLANNKKLKSKIKKIIINKDQVKIEYSIEDTGVLVNHFFSFKNGHWMLTNIEDQSD